MPRLATILYITSLVAACGSDDAGNGDTAAADSGPAPAEQPVVCDTSSAESLAECVNRDRYVDGVEYIAGNRAPQTSHHDEVRDYCADVLSSAGFEVEVHDFAIGENVIGIKRGDSKANELVMLSGHYDSTRGCTGADDNATGVSGVLEMARVLGGAEFERTLVVACWDQEEIGLYGSSAYAIRARMRDEHIAANLVFDMIGYTNDSPGSQDVPDGFDELFPALHSELSDMGFRATFAAVSHDDSTAAIAAAMETATEARGTPTGLMAIPDGMLRDKLFGRSDHAPFWRLGYPAMLVGDTAGLRYAQYHCYSGEDDIDHLDHDFATAIVRGSVVAVVNALELTGSGDSSLSLAARPPAIQAAPISCSEVCAQVPYASESDGECALAALDGAGYPAFATAACQGIDSVAGCMQCMNALDVKDADCALGAGVCQLFLQ